ncbi:MAG: Fur family transcriptional regulator [Ilumatobacteraceae bacterium]
MSGDLDRRNASSIHDIASERLEAIDQRYSPGRRRLVDVLANASHPLVTTEITSATDELPQSSVYRNLSILEEAGVVVKVLTTGERAAFELAEDLKGHHHHLVCVDCGRVIDVDLPDQVENLLSDGMSSLVAARGFTLIGHRLDLMGRCDQCSRSRREESFSTSSVK